MGAEEVGVLGDHLGLEPQAEFEAEGVDVIGELRHGATELGGVDGPVAEAGGVVVTMSEPSIVQHEHFDAVFGGGLAEGEELLAVEVEEHCLPAVDEDGARGIHPLGREEVLPHQVVECVGEFAEALVGAADERFGGLEGFAWGEVPAEGLRVDAQGEASAPQLGDIDLGSEVSAVNQQGTIDAASGLSGSGFA